MRGSVEQREIIAQREGAIAMAEWQKGDEKTARTWKHQPWMNRPWFSWQILLQIKWQIHYFLVSMLL